MTTLRCLLVALALAGAAGAHAAERVGVRVGEHPGFSRLVFDWAGPVAVRLDQAAGRATLHFDRAGDLDLTRFRADPPPNVLGVAAEPGEAGLVVVVRIGPDARPRLSEEGRSIVLDVLAPGTAADAKAATPDDWRRRRAARRPDPAPGPVPARKPEAPAAEQIAAPPDAPPARPEAAQAGGAPIPLLSGTMAGDQAAGPGRPAADAAGSPGAAGPKPEPVAKPLAKPTPGSRALGAPPAKAPPAKPEPAAAPPGSPGKDAKQGGADAEATAEDKAQDPTAEAAPDKAAPRSAGVLIVADPLPILVDTSQSQARPVAGGSATVLRFDWDSDVAAAAFWHGARLWLVFDRPPPGDLTAGITQVAPEVAPVDQFEASGATVLRLSAPPIVEPLVRREGSAWVVELWPGAPRPAPQVKLEIDAGERAAEVLFRIEEPGRLLSLTDPETSTSLSVVPSRAEDQGLAPARSFPQFRALRSFQGLAVEPLSDGVQVALAEPGVRVRAEDGLLVSHGSSLALLQSNTPSPPPGLRMLDPVRWRGRAGGFTARKQDLQAAVARAKPERLGDARLELARLFFAHGFMTEARGELNFGAVADPRLGQDPEVRLMRGITAFIDEDYEAAAADLFDSLLVGEYEAELWHGALAAINLDWTVAADRFARTADLIAAYPRRVRMRLRLLAAEAELGLGNSEAATGYLDQARGDDATPDDESQIALLVGHQLNFEGDTAGAQDLWRRIAERSTHAASRARARLALLDLDLESGAMSDAEAIEELETLRFVWRGDRFELGLLQRLGDLYAARGEYRQALRALRQAASNFPNSEPSQAAAQRMREVFTDLFIGPAAERLAPIRALALYEEFKELTPPGATGDAVIARLADRLIEVDLLDRAAQVLVTQIQFRLSGPGKAAAALRLALVYLLDQAPEKTIAALDLVPEPDWPADLVAERTRLKVRALTRLGSHDQALALLGGDDGPEALHLRAEILWAQANWPAVAVVLTRLVPAQAPADRPLSADESRDIAGLAVALTLSGERARLAELNQTFGQAMREAPDRETFALLTRGLDPSEAQSIAQELAAVDQAEAFLTSYRQGLQQAGAPAAN